RRWSDEQRQAVKEYIQEHADQTDRMIAEDLRISPTTVGKLRATMCAADNVAREGKDGRIWKPKLRSRVIETNSMSQRRRVQNQLSELGDRVEGNLTPGQLAKQHYKQQLYDYAKANQGLPELPSEYQCIWNEFNDLDKDENIYDYSIDCI